MRNFLKITILISSIFSASFSVLYLFYFQFFSCDLLDCCIPKDKCHYLLIANVFHLFVFITGILVVAFFISEYYFNKKKRLIEKISIWVIVFTGFLIYEIIDYDPLKAHWQHPPFTVSPMCEKGEPRSCPPPSTSPSNRPQ